MQLLLIWTNNSLHLMKVDNWLWYRAVQLLRSINRRRESPADSVFSQKASKKFWTCSNRVNKGCFTGEFCSHVMFTFQETRWLYLGNVKAKINHHIRLGQNTARSTYFLTLLKITALSLKSKKHLKPSQTWLQCGCRNSD